jgi:D-alanyl-D-alanine carboxypeptidase (penicillin-binding protein 5/6)
MPIKKILLIVSALLCFSAEAQIPQPPEIAARSYLLLDVTANQILAAKDIDSPVEPASLTKLMTAYLVFDALKSKKIDLKQTLPVSERAWKMPGSRMFIDPKMQVPVEDLIKGMIVQSGNDATVALAEGVGGSVERFVQAHERAGQGAGHEVHRLQEPRGPDRSRPHHHGARPERSGHPADARFSGLRGLLRHQEIPLPRHTGRQ